MTLRISQHAPFTMTDYIRHITVTHLPDGRYRSTFRIPLTATYHITHANAYDAHRSLSHLFPLTHQRAALHTLCAELFQAIRATKHITTRSQRRNSPEFRALDWRFRTLRTAYYRTFGSSHQPTTDFTSVA